jgi:hypothetical protein
VWAAPRGITTQLCGEFSTGAAVFKNPIEDFPDIYSPEALELMIHLTQGQPYLVQLMGQEAVNWLNANQYQELRVEHIPEIIPAVLERGNAYFRELWQLTLDESQRELILKILDGSLNSEGLSGNDRSILRRLERKGLVAARSLSLQVPLVQHYIERETGSGELSEQTI